MQKFKGFLFLIFLSLGQFSNAQSNDSTESIHYLSGNIGITTNGISIVPSFSLNKPAVQFNLAMGQKRFSFEPDIRFSVEGKPWSIGFWERYKIITRSKFNMNTGANLGLNFQTSLELINGEKFTTTITRRYLAGEIFPRYSVAKNISIGIYYLYAHGLDAGTIGNTHFIALNTKFSEIKFSGKVFLKINPQIYYLKLDAQDGYYFSNTITIAKKNLPFAASSTINQKINSNITGSENLIWNVSLLYSFNK